PMSLDDLRPWDRRIAVASALLLAAYLLVAIFAGASPSSDPQQGMAQGFIVFVGVVLLAVGALLWFGVARNHPWVVRVVFVLAVYPAVAKTAELIYLALHRARVILELSSAAPDSGRGENHGGTYGKGA